MNISKYINALFGINLKYFLSGLLASSVAIFFYYPRVFYFLVFLLYSVLLILGGKLFFVKYGSVIS